MCIRNASELSTKNVSYICHTPENKLGFWLSLLLDDWLRRIGRLDTRACATREEEEDGTSKEESNLNDW